MKIKKRRKGNVDKEIAGGDNGKLKMVMNNQIIGKRIGVRI